MKLVRDFRYGGCNNCLRGILSVYVCTRGVRVRVAITARRTMSSETKKMLRTKATTINSSLAPVGYSPGLTSVDSGPAGRASPVSSSVTLPVLSFFSS